MRYICPDLICPYCGKHTFYVIDKVQFWVSEQTCQSCGKIFEAISELKGTSVKSYESFPDKIDLEKDVFIHYHCYIPSKREEELCKIEDDKDGKFKICERRHSNPKLYSIRREDIDRDRYWTGSIINTFIKEGEGMWETTNENEADEWLKKLRENNNG